MNQTSVLLTVLFPQTEKYDILEQMFIQNTTWKSLLFSVTYVNIYEGQSTLQHSKLGSHDYKTCTQVKGEYFE